LDKIVVRQHPIGLLFGGMLIAVALLFLSLAVAGLNGDGVELNGKLTRDVGDVAPVLGMLVALIPLGAGMAASARNSRVEMTAEGVAAFDWLSRPLLTAHWSEVLTVSANDDVKRHWAVAVEGKRVLLPSNLSPPENLILGFARWARPGSLGKPSTPHARPAKERIHRFRDDRLHLPMFFCLAWNGALLLTAVVVATARNALGALVFLPVLMGFGGVGAYMWVGTWAMYLRASLEVTTEGLAFRNASGKCQRMTWDDVRCVAEFRMDNMSYNKPHLVIATSEIGICIPADLSNYDEARAAILDALPPDARVLLPDS